MAGSGEAEGPADQGPRLSARQDGDVVLGKDVFRNETFGNEGFWTDAVRLPAGIEAAKVTPMQALSLGLQVDVDAIDPFTVAQLSSKGKTLGRASTGLTPASTEAEFDAYFRNPANYPVGMFDDSFDGNGNPMHNTPLFRQDLAAPYGSEGLIARLDNFSKLVYTTLFDQTMLTTPGGRAFVHKLAGATGDQMIDGYVNVLAAMGVSGYPYVRAAKQGMAGDEENPIQFRVESGGETVAWRMWNRLMLH